MTGTRGTVLHPALCCLALALAACGADTTVSSPATADDNLLKLFEYDPSAHGLNGEAVRDRHTWLAEQIGIRKEAPSLR